MLPGQNDLVSLVEYNQLSKMGRLDSKSKESFEQFFTPGKIARLMASFLTFDKDEIRILDPGSGTGILFAACIEKIIETDVRPRSISVVAYEADPSLETEIKSTLEICENSCKEVGIDFKGDLRTEDFIEDSIRNFGLFKQEIKKYTHVIMNPPYRKLNTSSDTYRSLKSVGRNSPNLYTAFMSVAEAMLESEGEMVTITPRSFCNGVYFQGFRKQFLSRMKISNIRLFTSRNRAFRIDKVLQENIIIKWVKTTVNPDPVTIANSEGPESDEVVLNETSYDALVAPNDGEYIIRIPSDRFADVIRDYMEKLPSKLSDMGLKASTGPIVDFRSTLYIKSKKSDNTVPLIQPECVRQTGFVIWNPDKMKKAPYITLTDQTRGMLNPDEVYVVTKRFTSNEEKKRIVASVYLPIGTHESLVGFENRLNYIHSGGRGLDEDLAKGIALFLNSTMVDSYFRQISGHTQVNASDLMRLRFPDRKTLEDLGRTNQGHFLSQKEIDGEVKKKVFKIEDSENSPDPVGAKEKITEAVEILKDLGLPRAQQNERSALTLLALLDLKPGEMWSDASAPLIGITPMMAFFDEYYGKKYAPNSRETVRRFTVHQFCQAHLAVENPDGPKAPNSPNYVYQIDQKALDLIHSYGTDSWNGKLMNYLKERPKLDEQYRGTENKRGISVKISPEIEIIMSREGQNKLVKKIVEVFAPKFIKKPNVLYVGDAADKFLYYKEEELEGLGVKLDKHGKIPDVIIHDVQENWLFLIEAVTSHGPINRKRKNELEKLFEHSSAGLVYVTAFDTRADMVRYLREISWESEVWVAESPDHMIHFNGDRFLGPHDE